MRLRLPQAGLLLLLLFLGAMVLAPSTASANSRVWPSGYWGPILSCTGNYGGIVSTTAITNTCNDFCDLLSTGQNVLDFATTVVVFVGAPVMIIIGGVLLMVGNPFGGGESSGHSAAKKIIVSTLVGIGITLGAWVFLSTFLWLTGNGPTSAIQISWPEIRCDLPPPPAS